MNIWLRSTLIVLTALAYPLAFAPFDQAWILAFVFPGFLASLSGLSFLPARGAGFVWGMLAFGTGVPWFYSIFGKASFALFAILAIFVVLFAVAYTLAERRGWRGFVLAFYVAVAWSSLEFVRCEVFWLKFPWLSLGSAVSPMFLHPIIGTYGVGFVGALTSAMVIHCRGKLQAIAAVAGLCLFSLPPFLTPDSCPIPRLRVSGIQAEGAQPEHYLELSKSAPPSTDLIIWPEYSIPFDLRKSSLLFDTLKSFAAEHHVVMVVGTQTHGSNGRWRNTALTFDGTGVLGEHYKQHTVHFFNDGTPGDTELPVNTRLGSIGTPVCFDCDFQDVVRKMTLNGAQFFAVPMMDAEGWTRRQHLQHAQLFRLRAAENGRWMAVVGSSGVSQIIDGEGFVRSTIPPLTAGILNGHIAPFKGLTFYTRHGWLFPWFVVTTFCLVLLSFLRRVRQRKEGPSISHSTSARPSA